MKKKIILPMFLLSGIVATQAPVSNEFERSQQGRVTDFLIARCKENFDYFYLKGLLQGTSKKDDILKWGNCNLDTLEEYLISEEFSAKNIIENHSKFAKEHSLQQELECDDISNKQKAQIVALDNFFQTLKKSVHVPQEVCLKYDTNPHENVPEAYCSIASHSVVLNRLMARQNSPITLGVLLHELGHVRQAMLRPYDIVTHDDEQHKVQETGADTFMATIIQCPACLAALQLDRAGFGEGIQEVEDPQEYKDMQEYTKEQGYFDADDMAVYVEKASEKNLCKAHEHLRLTFAALKEDNLSIFDAFSQETLQGHVDSKESSLKDYATTLDFTNLTTLDEMLKWNTFNS